MSPGIKAGAALFVVALPLMLYLTAPPVPTASRQAALAIGPAGGSVAEPVHRPEPRLPKPLPVTRPALRPATTAIPPAPPATERPTQTRVPQSGFTSADEVPEAYAPPAWHAERQDHTQYIVTEAMAPPRQRPLTAAAGVETIARIIPGDTAASPGSLNATAASPEEAPAAEPDEYAYLPTGTLDEDLPPQADAPFDCSQALYMGGNAYGRNMRVAMGCAEL
jgi:hypothetical protein